MNGTKAALRNEIRQLAEEAFHSKLISGYGDGADSDEFQILFEGKPRHFPLQEARSFLNDLLLSGSIK
ncbi:MAG: hypothetical protein KME54_27310 [Tolypothrix brevis GSE-NOS-MK-07-07A]|jgi:hypothetical protein|nr:hypothetical protein [Tolypothrix brevis GSE-NOS-MK-07-07A]